MWRSRVRREKFFLDISLTQEYVRRTLSPRILRTAPARHSSKDGAVYQPLHRGSAGRTAAVILLGVVVALCSSSTDWTPRGADAGPPPNLQPFYQAANWITCYDSEPTTSLGCQSTAAERTIAGIDQAVSSYEVVNLPWGTRRAWSVTFTPGDWTYDVAASASSTLTARTAIGCGQAALDIFAPNAAGGHTWSAWPSASQWPPYVVASVGVTPLGSDAAVSAVKPTAPSFTPVDYLRATVDNVWRDGTPPTQATYGPIAAHVLVEEAPFRPGLLTTSIVLANPLQPPSNAFECWDRPYDVVFKNTRLRSPRAPGLYPRWTIFETDPDVRNGGVEQLVDLQCVTVGGFATNDDDGDCLQDASAGGADSNDSNADQDGDLLVDGIEYALGWSLTSADGDADGADDYDELFNFTDPNNPDTDFDGSLDKQDLLAGFPADSTDDDNCPAVFNPDQANTDSLRLVSDASGLDSAVLWKVLEAADTQAKIGSTDGYSDSGGLIWINGQSTSYSTRTAGTPGTLDGLSTHTRQLAPSAVVHKATQMNGGISASTLPPFDIAVGTVATLPEQGVARIDQEYVRYVDVPGQSWLRIIERGLNNTEAADHVSGALVEYAIGPESTSILVGSNVTAAPPPTGMLRVGEELISYTAKSGTTTFAGVVRGANNTLPAYHASVPVYFLGDNTNPAQDRWGDACDDDDDNDGLLDVVELNLHIKASDNTQKCRATDEDGTGSAVVFLPTNPVKPDSDGDMAIDGAECMFTTNPRDATSNLQTGGEPADRLENGPAETYFRTQFIHVPGGGSESNPDGDGNVTGDADSDSDNDGIIDGVEVKFYGTNPANDDTDGDGCSDGREAASFDNNRDVTVIDLQKASARAGLYRDSATGTIDPTKLIYDPTRNGTIDTIDLQFVSGQYGTCTAQIGIQIVKNRQ
jgi:hypothetical protein